MKQISVSVKGVGNYRDIINKPRIEIKIPYEGAQPPSLYKALDILDEIYRGAIYRELLNEDQSFSIWTRILLNGRDIKFLDKKLTLEDGDNILIMSVLAGG